MLVQTSRKELLSSLPRCVEETRFKMTQYSFVYGFKMLHKLGPNWYVFYHHQCACFMGFIMLSLTVTSIGPCHYLKPYRSHPGPNFNFNGAKTYRSHIRHVDSVSRRLLIGILLCWLTLVVSLAFGMTITREHNSGWAVVVP
ncbi:hypothetical protein C8Q75DRAFT_179595 [Abortiporus biennis]|nr:hypothetical protein C8Q75DRAFT_179595 [Abortiporus biennis]